MASHESARPDWHQKPVLVESLRRFHDNNARQPTDEMTKAKETHTKYINVIESKLKELGRCTRIEYTGSSYEGVKVSNDLEFDILVIIPLKASEVHVEPSRRPGFYTLRCDQSTRFDPRLCDSMETDSLVLSPEKTTKSFLSTVQKIINTDDDMRAKIILKRKPTAPSIQMDVLKNRNDPTPWYFVDVVPALEIDIPGMEEKSRFVAKSSDVPRAWRVSFSMQEKALFSGMDKDQGCRKQCIRILKVLRNKEAGLKKLTSYHLKTALFYESKRLGEAHWKPAKIGERVMGLLTLLRNAAKRAVLPHYFMPQINLMEAISPATLGNIDDRLSQLVTNEVQFMRAIAT